MARQGWRCCKTAIKAKRRKKGSSNVGKVIDSSGNKKLRPLAIVSCFCLTVKTWTASITQRSINIDSFYHHHRSSHQLSHVHGHLVDLR